MAKKRVKQTINEQVENVFEDEYLRNFCIRTVTTAENVWRLNNPNTLEEPRVLEIGGAGGITKRIRPNYLISDVRKSNGVDIAVDAQQLPFSESEFDLILAIDVIHHIENLKDMFEEIHRVLKPGGIFFIREPYWGPLAQIVWRMIHPEDFSVNRLFKGGLDLDPMAGNQALAQALIKKQSKVPADLINQELILHRIGEMSGLAFLLSGGATFRTRFPRKLLMKLEKWELKHRLWLKVFGFSTAFYYVKVKT